MNILITSASRKVSLVKAFKDALIQEGEGTISAVDINPLSAALYHSDLMRIDYIGNNFVGLEVLKRPWEMI